MDVETKVWSPVKAAKARDFAGLSQRALADKLGISERSLRYYETGERVPDVDVAAAWASVCSVALDALLEPPAKKI